MGAYLSEPVTEKLSSDEEGVWLNYGSSSMQGWRVSQEDAHNSILNFDDDTHIFAVYDGHGGHEVSAYTALKLPDYIKKTKAYKDGRLPAALIDTFLGLDATLVKPEVVTELKIIAGTKDDDDDDDSDSEGEDVQDLYREATMPLDQVMARYPHLAQHGKDKVASPFLKAKGTSSEASDQDSPTKFDFKEDQEEEEASNSASEKSDTKHKAELNGEGPKHMVNGEEEEDTNKEVKEEKENATKVKVKENGQKAKEEKMEEEDSKTEAKKENGDTAINGEEEEGTVTTTTTTTTGKGKGKGSGKGGKGKALLKNSEIQAMKEAKAKGRRREAAIKAAEIYKKIQEGGGEGAMEEDGSDEDEDEEDDNFEEEEAEGGDEDEGEEDADGEESEEEEEDEDEDEVEVEEDEDPYAEFAMNMKEEPGYDSGCTACVAVVKTDRITVANVGDSRCVVSRAGTALDLSIDHKPEDDIEAARIIRAGGRVTADGRVNGGLNLSRAIGDHGYKQNKSLEPEEQMISPLPDVRSLALTPQDKFMIVACDGIWNSFTSQEACDFVTSRMEDNMKLSKICEELFDHCLAPDTHGDGTGCDNMTCIIIKFDPETLKSRGDKNKDEGVIEEEVVREKKEKEKEEEEEEEEEEDEEDEEDEGEEEEKEEKEKTKKKTSGGVKRGAEEAEINSPKAEEKKLKASE